MIRAAILLCVLGALTGCARPDGSGALLALKAGISPGELRVRLQSRGRHQVTAAVDGKEVLCVSCRFIEEWDELYFVFRDDELEKVITPPPASYATKIRHDERVSVKLPVDPEQRLAAVLESPALSQAQIAGLIDEWRLNERRRREQEGLGVLPVVIILSPLFVVMAPVYVPLIAVVCAHEDRVAQQFDPRRIRVGMTTDEVDAAFGAPNSVTASEAGTVRVYGVSTGQWTDEDHRVCVVLQDDHVVRVFSNDFFDGRLTSP